MGLSGGLASNGGISLGELPASVANVSSLMPVVVASGDTTGATDTAAIKAAILTAAGPNIGAVAGGGRVYFQDAIYYLNATVEIPDSVQLVGVGANSGPWPNVSGNNLGTRMLAAATFPAMCPMFALGARLPAVPTTGVVFSVQMVGMTIDGADVATVGIYTNKAQEHSRLSFVTPRRCTMIGIHVASPNGPPGSNQTNNFGMDNIKAQPTKVNAYKVTSLNGAITVTTGTNPFDAASNYCNPVTTSGQATGTVLITDTTGFPAAGCVIVTQQSQQAPVVVYYTSVSGNSLVGCYTDATPTQTPSLSIASNAQVETPACGAYVQNVGAMRGIADATFDSGSANATCVGLRLDGANGMYERLHCEHVKYGVLASSASMCAGAELDHVMLGGDNTVVDLVRIGTAGSGNSHNSLVLRSIMSYVSGPNTINDLANSNTLTDEYVALYVIGESTSGLSGAARPIISSSSRVLSKFTKGFFGPTKTGADFADSDFVNPADGLSGYRIDNGSFQWRANGTWHSTATIAYYPWSINNLLGWSFDPAINGVGVAITSGQLMLSKVMITPGSTITNLLTYVTAAGTGLTAQQCFAALYDSSGNLIGQTGDTSGAAYTVTTDGSTATVTGTGFAAAMIGTQYTIAGVAGTFTVQSVTNSTTLVMTTIPGSAVAGAAMTPTLNFNWASVASTSNLKTMPLVAHSGGSLTVPGTWVYAMLLSNGGTPPSFANTAGSTANTLTNAGLAAANGFRGGTILTGQTSVPTPSITLGNVANIGNFRWAGVN